MKCAILSELTFSRVLGLYQSLSLLPATHRASGLTIVEADYLHDQPAHGLTVPAGIAWRRADRRRIARSAQCAGVLHEGLARCSRIIEIGGQLLPKNGANSHEARPNRNRTDVELMGQL